MGHWAHPDEMWPQDYAQSATARGTRTPAGGAASKPSGSGTGRYHHPPGPPAQGPDSGRGKKALRVHRRRAQTAH
jgi:hypothetical protein